MDDDILCKHKKKGGSIWIKYLRIFFSSRHCVETDY